PCCVCVWRRGRPRCPLFPYTTLFRSTGVVAEVGGGELPAAGGLPTVVEVLEASGVVPSRSAARRTIAEGGAYLNNEKLTDPEARSEEHTSELQSREKLVCRLLLEKKK